MLYPDKNVTLYFNIRNNDTDEVELYESKDIQIGLNGDECIIRTEIINKN